MFRRLFHPNILGDPGGKNCDPHYVPILNSARKMAMTSKEHVLVAIETNATGRPGVAGGQRRPGAGTQPGFCAAKTAPSRASEQSLC